MVSFKHRSSRKELMDGKDIPSELLHKNLGELDILNRYFCGYSLSIEGIKQLIVNPKKEYHIVDLGCGGGDVLKYIARWASSNSYRVRLTGIDINPDAISYLEINCAGYPEIKGVVSDYKDYLATNPTIDIIHCSLFCHHLENTRLLELFQMLKSCACGFVINDLQRSRIAWFGAWLMPRLLNGSTLSKHDGTVSVLRAFTRDEISELLIRAGIKKFKLRWCWAFRYLVIAKTDDNGNY